MDAQTLLLIFACSATAHLIAACTVGIYARYKVQYLGLMWVDAIFAFSLLFTSFFTQDIADKQPVMLHPLMLLTLSALSYLQSIFPLGITMPGFLEWGRMLRYAIPLFCLNGLYFALTYLLGDGITLDNIHKLGENLYSWDVAFRVASIVLSGYYIINIWRLPRRMAHTTEVPAFLLGYCTALCLALLYYLYISVFYNVAMVGIYVIIFTLLNVYLTFRTLEEMAIHLPTPKVMDDAETTDIEEEDNDEEEKDEDFNLANQHRYQRIQHWMQAHKELWLDGNFGRDRLCEEVGLNRHLLLQSLRSQGFNNVHDFIVSYRVAELKRLILRGEVTSLADTSTVGFGTLITARNAFLKVEGTSLDRFLEKHRH